MLLYWFGRRRVRWPIRDGIHEAFPGLACGTAVTLRRLASMPLCEEFLARLAAVRAGLVPGCVKAGWCLCLCLCLFLLQLAGAWVC